LLEVADAEHVLTGFGEAGIRPDEGFTAEDGMGDDAGVAFDEADGLALGFAAARECLGEGGVIPCPALRQG
jgi:hypothetical protein